MQRTFGYALLMLLAATCYGLTTPIMKLAYQAGFSVQDMTNAQYGLGLVILWLIWLVMIATRAASWPRLPRKQWLLLGAIGILNAVTSFGYYQALTVLPGSLGIILLFQFTWMVLLMDAIVNRRRPSWQQFAGIGVILLGTVLAVGAHSAGAVSKAGGLSTHGAHVLAWAIPMGLLGGLGYAAVLFLSGYISREGLPLYTSAISIVFSTVAITIPFHPTYLWSGVLWHGLWFWGLLVALSSQVIPLLLMLAAIPRIGGRMAGVLGSVELPVAVVSTHFLVNESVSAWRWVGVVLILLGIVLSEWIGNKSNDPSTGDSGHLFNSME